jgi:hypothetical protein
MFEISLMLVLAAFAAAALDYPMLALAAGALSIVVLGVRGGSAAGGEER